ncbi:MAG TPA: N-acetylmuramoyl-L-alanine amidase [Polyangiales bacterium]
MQGRYEARNESANSVRASGHEHPPENLLESRERATARHARQVDLSCIGRRRRDSRSFCAASPWSFFFDRICAARRLHGGARKEMTMSQPTIILDPGHGGSAPAGKSTPYGAPHASGQHEKVINLELARRVIGALPGHDIRLTRDDDRNLSLGARAGLARSFGGDTRFVSLHSNWGYPNTLGSQTWVHTRASSSSHRLAARIQGALARLPAGGPLAVQAGELAVLDPMALGPGAAACLVEAQLPTDPIGNPMVPPPNHLDIIARAIAHGIQTADHADAQLPTTNAYGGAEVIIGANGWREVLNSRISAREPFHIVITGERLVGFLNDVVAEARRRGMNLLEMGISDIRRLLALAEEAGSHALSLARQWLAPILPWPLSEALGIPGSYPQALALPALAVVAIVLIVAAVIFMIARTVFDWLTDRETNETIRTCVERGYTPSLDRDRSRTDGINVDRNRGFNTGGNDRIVVTCTPSH